jgi:hypothetical protein
MKTIASGLLVPVFAAMLLAGCGGGETEPPVGTPGSPSEPLPPTTPAPPTDPTVPNPTTPAQPVTPTAVGTVQGTAASAQIGPAGGVLTSFDGYLTLTVPAGAFDSARQVTIEPISNQAHGAKGPAYRISPEGLNTPVPMTLTFKVDPVSLRGTTLNALTIATQDADGRWTGTRTPQRNATAATVSVQTSHFSDWGLIAGVQLYPATAQVAIEESLDLKIIRCPWVADADAAETIHIDQCKADAAQLGETHDWAVNGVVGGSTPSGTIAPISDSADPQAIKALFHAPNHVPPANPVAVSVRYLENSSSTAQLQLVSNVTIVEDDPCNWLHNATTLNYEIEMAYTFAGSGPLGVLSLDQRGTIIGEMTQQFDGNLMGVWRGLSTRGHAAINDQHTYGTTTSQLTGNGVPTSGTGIDENQLSLVTVVVDYTSCTYSIAGQVAVIASAGADDEPRVHNVAGFTRGNLPVDLRFGLVGLEYMPPRLQPDVAGTFFPGGLGVGLVADGYASEENAGKGMVRWNVTR